MDLVAITCVENLTLLDFHNLNHHRAFTMMVQKFCLSNETLNKHERPWFCEGYLQASLLSPSIPLSLFQLPHLLKLQAISLDNRKPQLANPFPPEPCAPSTHLRPNFYGPSYRRRLFLRKIPRLFSLLYIWFLPLLLLKIYWLRLVVLLNVTQKFTSSTYTSSPEFYVPYYHRCLSLRKIPRLFFILHL